MLLHRHRLTREGRLLHLQVYRLQQSQIGRDDITCIEDHDVTRHDGGGDHLRHLSPAQHLGLRCTHPVQCLERRLCLPLLYRSDDRVDDQDGQDHIALGQSLLMHHANHTRHDGGDEEDHHHAALELLEEDGNQRFLLF